MSKQEYKILIIDDSSEDRATFRYYLEQNSECMYEFLEAEFGAEGVTACLESKPDCVLLDNNLPDSDGLAVLKAINPDPFNPNFAVVLLTDSGSEVIDVNALKNGAQDYLVKGEITAEDLHLSISKVIEVTCLRKENLKIIEELRQSKELLMISVNVADFAICEIDYTSNINHLSKEAAQLFGLGEEEMNVSRDAIHATFHPDERVEMAKFIEESLNPDGDGWFACEHRIILPNGNVRRLNVRKQIFFDRTANPPRPVRGILAAQDITERKNQQVKLELYRLLSERSRDIMLFFRTDGKFVEVNQAAVNAYGYTREELLGKSFYDIRAEATWNDISVQMRQAEKSAFQFETVHRRKDGTEFPAEASWSLTELDGERVILSIVRDISERKQAEKHVRESDERMRLANEATGIGVWEWNIITNQIRWDAEIFRIYGIEPTKDSIVQYEDWSSSVLPEDLPRNEEILKETVRQTGNSRRTFRIRRRNDGKVRHIEAVETVRANAEGKTEWVVGTNLDVTERKLAAETLRVSEERLSLAMEGAKISAFDWNIKMGEIQWSNQTEQSAVMAADFDNSFEKFHELIYPPDRELLKQHIEAAFMDGEYECEFRMLHGDGTLRWVIGKGRVFFDDEDNPARLIGVDIDITEQKRREANLAFLAELNEVFAPHLSADELINKAGEQLVAHLNLSRAVFFAVDEDTKISDVFYDSHATDVSGVIGKYDLTQFHSEEEFRAIAGGQTFVTNNVCDGKRAAEVAATYEALDIRALITAPYLSDGQWKFAISAQHDQPYQWRADEIELLNEVIARIYLRHERARAEEALRASHETFRHLVEKSPFGIYTVDADFRLAQVSAGAQKVFENVRPAIGRDFAEVISIIWTEPFASEVIAHFSHTLETGEPYHAPSTIEQRSDSREVEVYDWKLERITLPDGRFGVVCHFYDLSERQAYEAALRDSERKLRLAIDAAAMTTWELNLKTGGRTLGDNYAEVFGSTPFMPEEFMAAIFPEDRERVSAALQSALASNEAYRLEFRTIDTQGKLRWVESFGQLIKDEQGAPATALGVAINVTERKQAEDQIRESEELFRAIFESIDEGFCIIEMIFDEHNKPLDYRFVQANLAFERLTGLENAVGKTALELIPKLEDFWFETYGKVALTGESVRFENESVPMNRWFEVYASRIGKADNRRIALVFNNITERKLVEREREESLKREQLLRYEAESANLAKDEFLAMLSHELRTPLNSMYGWTHILQSNNLDTEQSAKAIETIARNLWLQNTLIEDILDVSRIVSDKMKLDSEEISLVVTVQSALEIANPAAEKKDIQIQFTLDPHADNIFGDKHRLLQIVNNLMTNAIKFTPSGGIINVELQNAGDKAKLIIKDSGIGIKPEFLPQIFDRFRQADSSSKRKYSGLGLGLTIVKHLVELHGGTVSAHSEGENLGSTFIVELPLSPQIITQADLKSAEIIHENKDNKVQQLTGRRILVVDDDPDALDLMRFVLEQNGADITCVSSATGALQKLQDNDFDLLISDLGMAEMDGLDLIRHIRKNENKSHQLPAIALTGFVSVNDRERVLQAGFQAHLTKPMDIENLSAMVMSLIKS